MTQIKPKRPGVPSRWINTPTVLIRVPKIYADLVMLVAIALDRMAVSEKEIESLINSKLKEEPKE